MRIQDLSYPKDRGSEGSEDLSEQFHIPANPKILRSRINKRVPRPSTAVAVSAVVCAGLVAGALLGDRVAASQARARLAGDGDRPDQWPADDLEYGRATADLAALWNLGNARTRHAHSWRPPALVLDAVRVSAAGSDRCSLAALFIRTSARQDRLHRMGIPFMTRVTSVDLGRHLLQVDESGPRLRPCGRIVGSHFVVDGIGRDAREALHEVQTITRRARRLEA